MKDLMHQCSVSLTKSFLSFAPYLDLCNCTDSIFILLLCSLLADHTNCRAYATVLCLSSVLCRRASVCIECIVAKRCVLEQKLLLTAYSKLCMRNRLAPK